MITSHIIQSAMQLRNYALSSLKAEVRSNPSIAYGTHKSRGKTIHVIRIITFVNGKRKISEYALSSAKGKHVQSQSQKIHILRKALDSLHSESSSTNQITPVTNSIVPFSSNSSAPVQNSDCSSPLTFTLDEWISLTEWNDPQITNGYRHGNHVFRSKSELIIAQLLESLGLEYKYEPKIIIAGTERRPDFAVYCPETGRYFLIEHLGLLSDTRYRMDAIAKMEQYEKGGLREGIDIIYTTEFNQGNFNVDAAFGKITGLVLAQSAHLTIIP